jgi:hypothetical protein
MAHKIFIIENIKGTVYTYFEESEHFVTVTHKTGEGSRDMSKWIPPEVFDGECDTKRALESGEWTSILVK